jgi:tryptophan synthase alpha chain
MIIEKTFAELTRRRQMALIPYITCGYPSLSGSLDIVALFSEHGADIIEIGVPFSDPIADGPTIQYASQAALENGMTLKKIIKALKDVHTGVPLILMSYLNPILAYGPDRFFRDIAEARIAGMIIPDLPVEESIAFIRRAKDLDLAIVQMVSPTSTDERIRLITEHAGGFVYCVSATGTTGSRAELPAGIMPFVKKVKKITSKPVAVGFGISTPEQVQSLRDHADGVIIGSRIIDAVKNNEDLAAVITSFRNATRR